MDISEIETAAKDVAAEPAKLAADVAAAKTYETDLITFVTAHKWLAAQFALIVATPVAFLAFEIGKHFHA